MTQRPEDEAVRLTESNFAAAEDPFLLFGEWFDQAKGSEPNDPDAMALATVDEAGMPDVRMVLLKDFDPSGFVFYTNLDSAKGRQLAANPRAAFCIHWKSLRRQVRARGDVTPVDPAEADAYFASRARRSRLGAWASKQSRPLESRFALEKAIALFTARFAAGTIPRPPHWSGFRIVPQRIEFWRDGAFRLHERLQFSRRADGGWERSELYP